MPEDIAYKPLEEPSKIYPGGTLTPPKFLPTYFEWLKAKGIDVRGNAPKNLSSGYATVYTRPTGYTLYLTGYNITATAMDDAMEFGEIILFVADNPVNPKYSIAGIQLDTRALQANNTMPSGHVARDFTYPIKITEKYITIYSTSAKIAGRVHITGFLVKNADIPIF